MAVNGWLCVFLVALLLFAPACNAARDLRDSSERSLFEETYESEKRSSWWSNQESGDDAVPVATEADNYATKYREWVRLQELVTQDYSTVPAAANPSAPMNPCC